MSQSNPPFKVGDKVECIELWSHDPMIQTPIKGDIYTIRSIEYNYDRWSLRFEEIQNPIDPMTKEEIWFSAGYDE